MTIRRRLPRTQPPQQPVAIDRGNPLAHGLVFAAYPVGGALYDAVSGLYSNTASRLRVRGPVDGNRAASASISGDTTDAVWALPTGADRVTGAISVFVEGSLETNGTTCVALESRETSVGTGFRFNFDDVASITNGYRVILNQASVVPSLSNALGTNSEQFTHRVMAVCDGSNAFLYSKRALNRSTSYSVFPTSNANRRTAVRSGSLALGLVYNRALSLAEYQALYDNPWQVFAPQPRALFAGAAGGDADVPLSDSAAGSDASSIAAALSASDSASGADGISVDAGDTPVDLDDSASGSDAASIAAAAAGADNAAGSDEQALAAALAPADSVAGAEEGGTEAALGASDAAAGSDGIEVDTGTADRDLDLADAGEGSDELAVEVVPERVLGRSYYQRRNLFPRDSAQGASWIRVDRRVGDGTARVAHGVVLLPAEARPQPLVEPPPPPTGHAVQGAARGASAIVVDEFTVVAARVYPPPPVLKRNRPALLRSGATR